MTICEHYEADPRELANLARGEIARGCISCRHMPALGPCRATGRGQDEDARTYRALSGKRYTLEDENDTGTEA